MTKDVVKKNITDYYTKKIAKMKALPKSSKPFDIELREMKERAFKKARKQTLEEVLKEHDDNYQKGESYEVLTHYGYKWLEQKIKELR